MRSVYIFLDEPKNNIIKYLDQRCENNKNIQWLLKRENDIVLFIEFDEKKSIVRDIEYITEESGTLDMHIIKELKLKEILTVDISCIALNRDVFEFVEGILRNFNGVVMDDYTEHLWTIEEIQKGVTVSNHKFLIGEVDITTLSTSKNESMT